MVELERTFINERGETVYIKVVFAPGMMEVTLTRNNVEEEIPLTPMEKAVLIELTNPSNVTHADPTIPGDPWRK